MKVKLIKPARINHDAGDIVEVSPAVADFLFSVGSAEPVKEAQEAKQEAVKAEAKAEPKKTTKKVTNK